MDYGQNDCIKCPKGFTTKRRGARELSDCKGTDQLFLRGRV